MTFRAALFIGKQTAAFVLAKSITTSFAQGGNEIILAAAGKAIKDMPKPIPDDKGGALTIDGNVGVVSGHKVSVGKVVKPRGVRA